MNQESQLSSLGRATVMALLIGLLFALALVLLSYFVEDLQIATRSATDLVMPVGLIWIGLFVSIAWFAVRRIWSAAILSAIGFVFVGITANPYVSSQFIQWIEWPEQSPQATREIPYRTVVVLGGATTLTPQQTVELYRDGERLFSAAQLWHSGLVSSIICTGSDSDGVAHPRDHGMELLESVGVPNAVIFKVPGENTTQEMKALKEFLADPPTAFPKSGDTALMTSAFHMRRAMRLAESYQLDLDPLPCAYRSRSFHRFSPRAMIPNADGASAFGDALKECLAGLVGR